MNEYAIDLSPYYEDIRIKPLLQNSIVSNGKSQFITHRWFRGETHCYVFVCIKGKYSKPFAKKPSNVKELIDTGVLIVDKHFNME